VSVSLSTGAYVSFHELYRRASESTTKYAPFPRLSPDRTTSNRWRRELLGLKCIKAIKIGKETYYSPTIAPSQTKEKRSKKPPKLLVSQVVEVASDRRQYFPIVEPQQVSTSTETRGGRRNEIAIDVLSEQSAVEQPAVVKNTRARHEHPISRGRHLPNGHVLIEFVNAVQRELHVLKVDRMVKIGEAIANLKIELTNTEDLEYEKLYMRELQKLVDERSRLDDEALIDAIKYVEAKKPFSEYQWTNELVSIRPEDYVNRTIE
jgi:hypothetical protein